MNTSPEYLLFSPELFIVLKNFWFDLLTRCIYNNPLISQQSSIITIALPINRALTTLSRI